jgi:RecA-family ATPase
VNDEANEFFRSRVYEPPGHDEAAPHNYAPPIGEPVDTTTSRFRLEDWNDIDFDPNGEWLVEDVLPRRGLGLIYGKPRSLKSLILLHTAHHVILGRPWAGKRVEKGKVVYIAAEGALGMRKRIAAYRAKYKIPRGDFALISVAPSFGTGDGDLHALISAVESSGIKPAMIAVDTVAKSIGTAEENGTGMAAFVCNAEKLWQHFGCFVLGAHHVGLSEDAQKRPRGWSGLGGALARPDFVRAHRRREADNAHRPKTERRRGRRLL